MHVMLQPQEVEVFYILPAIRRELSIALKERGRSQKEIALLLGVTEAAVSNYLNDRRAKAGFPDELAGDVRNAAALINDRQSMVAQTQALLAKAKEGGLLCRLHAQLADMPRDCDICFR